ncbi:helix-turn-helix domain-containing protein [bacterium]|nr:helix-turn-helix domain-containing protein [bacterium]
MEPTEPWLSVEGISVHLGVSKETIYRWLERRRIPAHRIGKLWKFKASEVDNWIRTGGAIDMEDKNNRTNEL